MPFERQDIDILQRLVRSTIRELPPALRPSEQDARQNASEYGHWSRRKPHHALVNIGVQRAVNPRW